MQVMPVSFAKCCKYVTFLHSSFIIPRYVILSQVSVRAVIRSTFSKPIISVEGQLIYSLHISCCIGGINGILKHMLCISTIYSFNKYIIFYFNFTFRLLKIPYEPALQFIEF